MGNKRVKRETRVAKVGSKDTAVRRQLNGLSVAGQGTPGMLPKSPLPTPESLDGAHTRVKGSRLIASKTYVPVLSLNRKPLMPTTPARARKWVKSGKATPYWSRGVWCVRLNVESGEVVQPIAVGIDPGSKREGYTIKSESHTYLNIQANAITWVKESMSARREMRRSRRKVRSPYRSPRNNRMHGRNLPSSTKARWQWKLRIASWLCKLFPVDCFIVEDVKVESRGQPKWDKSFGPMLYGKNWFYAELGKFAGLETRQGYETFSLREQYGLKKSKNKVDNSFSSHCVDSWVLANSYIGGHIVPDNECVLLIIPLQFHRRQLHVFQPAKGNIRKRYGGMRSLGLKRGSIVFHVKHGVTYVGGTRKKVITLHSLETGERVSRDARVKDCTFLSYNSWRTVQG